MALLSTLTTPNSALSGLSPAGLLGTIVLLFLTTWSVRSYLRLRHIPGPRWAAFSKWWMLRNTVSGDMHMALKEVCDKYGTSERK